MSAFLEKCIQITFQFIVVLLSTCKSCWHYPLDLRKMIHCNTITKKIQEFGIFGISGKPFFVLIILNSFSGSLLKATKTFKSYNNYICFIINKIKCSVKLCLLDFFLLFKNQLLQLWQIILKKINSNLVATKLNILGLLVQNVNI